ncbi:MAG TPA: saccharopine dehydrogenase NADP-binding domain-containing protein [Caulobacteraceae bacterium]|nr:saccharopine dehydrogenase NADP-binding domain-containing protein [Caulobacteraceae bacterium]
MSGREFEVIVWGATGYTGRLVAEHLLKTYGAAGDLRWAVAGRSADKLADVKAGIGAPAGLPTIVADAADPASLDAMARRADAIITTVGPYQLYGSPLVAACAAAGTDYVDLTGESNWIAAMIQAHEAAAKASGARIVFSCGFDSIPFDLGVFYAEEQAKQRFGAYVPRVRGRVRGLKGGLSGGTLASGMATQAAVQKDPSIGALLADPFALTPGFKGPDQPDGDHAYEDKVAGSWVGPFMMAGINTKAVHRSNFLLGQRWGAGFQYDEMQMLEGPPDPAAGGGMGGFNFGAGGMPKPGEGPSREERETGFYDILVIAEAADGRTLRAAVKGDMDPGYGSTSKMLGESAVCLARDVSRQTTPGGCWTPASAMGGALIKRLEANAGLTFTTEN